MLEMSLPKREAFSINLNEDYEIYGIDPNEDLNDWSFLDAKPEPIPEKTEEEKRLFEQLLAPSIPDEEIQAEITDRLKSLLEETDKFIANDVKVELSAPIEISPEEAKPLIDTESFEHKQAARVSTIVKDILNISQKSEDLDDFLKNITKSDEIAEVIKQEEIKEEEEKSKSNSLSLSQKVENKENENNLNNEITGNIEIDPPKVIKEEQTSFLGRYIRKPGDVKTILRDHDETERLSSKFILERRKRQEEAEAELKRKQEEMEQKQKLFFESLEKEAEKHRREVQMIKEMKENHAPSFSEMLNNIQKKSDQTTSQKQPPITVKPKVKQTVKEPRMSEEKITEFFKLRETKIQASIKPPKQPIMIVLQSDQEEIKKPSKHRSNNYKNEILKELGKKLIPKIKERMKNKNELKKWRIAIFMKMAKSFKLNKLSKTVQKSVILKHSFISWRKKRLICSLQKTIAAIRIQSTFKKFNSKLKLKEAQRKAYEAALKAKALSEQAKKEISEDQLLEKTRQLVNQRAPENQNNTNNNSINNLQDNLKPKNNRNLKKPSPVINNNNNNNVIDNNDLIRKREKELDFDFGFPELPDLDDLDLDWLDGLEDLSDFDGFDDDDNENNHRSFLLDLPDYINNGNENKTPSPRRSNVQAESQSIPLDADEYNSFLSGFNQRIEFNDDPELQQQLGVSPGQNGQPQPPQTPPQQPRSPRHHNGNENSPGSIFGNTNGSNGDMIDEEERLRRQAAAEGYNFEDPRTAAMMRKMIQRRTNIANPYKNEKPVDKFKRLYGNTPSNNSGNSGNSRNQKYVAPVVRRSEFRRNDTRTRRLMRLKKIWLNGPDDQTEQPPPPPPPA
ncbi:hypothetical protein TRFO_30324 [Tritrichomonas foetus]|uniref:Uncharacterized protein n=1 Tax=Tritrichomonas foetus TaxID=1144522 RepID=A0A1J4JU18_9EUKA|nr:hypothetical protein TRFO_30324 [Tritrichomonas foetus]|eukprot:OHT02531.1 hypothetical protein TRFO_30324 [Tritrichomonas foetus]